ncbi:MAG TPA: DUF892 family protein [Fimbriimonadaceae bacterium]|nr:DUF892 family protein [Fimbriimonadaceae bacterium]
MDIHNVMMTEIQELHDAENQFAQALGFLYEKADDGDLRKALADHRTETTEHARRLEQICSHMGWQPVGKQSMVARALVEDTKKTLQNAMPSPTTDAIIIGAAQKAEHFEMASYGTVAAIADAMDRDFAKELLGKTLDEEKDADKLLTKIAMHRINKDAVRHSGRATVI